MIAAFDAIDTMNADAFYTVVAIFLLLLGLTERFFPRHLRRGRR